MPFYFVCLCNALYISMLQRCENARWNLFSARWIFMCTDIRAPCRRMPFIFPVGQEFLAYWVRIPSLLGRKNFSAGKFPYPFRSVQPGASSGVASSVQCPLLCVCICTQKQIHLSPIARYYIINKIMWNSVQLQYTDSLILDTGHWTLWSHRHQKSTVQIFATPTVR